LRDISSPEMQALGVQWLKPVLSIGVVAVLGVGCTSTVASNPGTAKPIGVRLELDRTSSAAGTPIQGTVVFTNKTSRSIMVHTCPIDGWLQVGLLGGTFHYRPSYSLVGCPPGAGIRMNPGVSRFPITVSTSYQSCQPPGSTTSAASSAGCVEPAPLRPGTYRTKVFIASFRPAFSAAAPVAVQVLPAS
jgi:hypothetical protein